MLTSFLQTQFLARCLAGLLAALAAWVGSTCRGGEIEFNRDVLPILAAKCFACHGPDASSRQAEMRLDVRASALQAIEPGNPQASALIARVTHSDPDTVMPPPATNKRIEAAELRILQQWIQQGARYAKHWAFSTPRRPQPPTIDDRSWVINDIDRFVLARLQQENWAPAKLAGMSTLIRRVTLDLTGLPPTPAEVTNFLADDSPGAYESLVSRLLESPRYGEHRASYWLDAARYADTDGYQNDRTRYQWAWRDWVIRALNENLPYDQFVIEQLAGDMLPQASLTQQVATGFCRNHRINSEAGSIAEEWLVENVVDRVDTLGTVFLGMTIGCARCHDHKYDPISQQEYYRLFAYFNNVPEWGVGPNNGNSPPFITLPTSWPDLADVENRRIEPLPLAFKDPKLDPRGIIRPVPGDESTVMVMHERQTRRPTYLLARGQYRLPDTSQPLTPGVPQSLDTVAGSPPATRLELARWLVDPAHPLTARVAVNRYWQQLFGIGLVKTAENFGTQGEMPTHPQLLDWLATQLMDNDWDVKSLLKTIVMSATYRQSSRVSEASWSRDPENRLLARGPRFRLPAFVIRDQALFASGLLVEKIGGPSVKPYMPPKIWRSISNNEYQQDQGDNLYRRSLYTYWRRTIPPPTMASLDSAQREVCSVRHDRTNTPLQALALMNNKTFVEASRFLAERMLKVDSIGGHGLPASSASLTSPASSTDSNLSNSQLGELQRQLVHGMRLMTGRSPRADELALLTQAHRQFQERFRDQASLASQLLSVGEKPRDQALPVVEHAAMTMTASLLMNLDRTITKD